MLHNEEQQRVRTTLVNYVEERTHMRLRHRGCFSVASVNALTLFRELPSRAATAFSATSAAPPPPPPLPPPPLQLPRPQNEQSISQCLATVRGPP